MSEELYYPTCRRCTTRHAEPYHEIEKPDGWTWVVVYRYGERVVTDSYWLCPDCGSLFKKWEVGE